MTSDRIVQPSATPARTKKVIIQLLLGMVVGAGSMILVMTALKHNLPAKPALDQVAAIGVGLIYALIALFVAFGVATPNMGSKLLNVADADELRDDRTYLLGSSVACITIGFALIALAVSGPAGLIAPEIALTILAIAVLMTILVWLQMRKGTDEFRRLVSAQASELAFALTLLLFGGWAALARLGYVALFSPLAFLSGAFGLVFVAAYWVAWRRGLLRQP